MVSVVVILIGMYGEYSAVALKDNYVAPVAVVLRGNHVINAVSHLKGDSETDVRILEHSLGEGVKILEDSLEGARILEDSLEEGVRILEDSLEDGMMSK